MKLSSRIAFAILSLPTMLLFGCFGKNLFPADAQKTPSYRTDPPKLKLSDPLPANLFVELARIANPAVVNISTMAQSNSGAQRDPLMEMLEQLYGLRQRPEGQPRPQALGTGFLIREDGLIVTNNHVVAQADVISVQLSEKAAKTYEAKVIGTDERTDIALIKIQGSQFPTLALGSSKDLEVGEWVAAFGNPFGNGHTLTKGVVSAKERDINEINRFPLLQTDTPINPGNSGGPLVNTKGLVVGVNSAIDARAQGIGFAIPIDEVKNILPTLEKVGKLKKGYLGVGLDALNPQLARALGLKNLEGAVISVVEEGGPADQAELKPYDVILKFGEKSIKGPEDLFYTVADSSVGSKVKVEIVRKGVTKTMTVLIGERPDANKNRKVRRQQTAKLSGQKAPFDLGIEVADSTPELRDNFNIEGKELRPLIVAIEPSSLAQQVGLRSGDIILDVNQTETRKGNDVLKARQVVQFFQKGTNTLRVARGPAVIFVTVDLGGR